MTAKAHSVSSHPLIVIWFSFWAAPTSLTSNSRSPVGVTAAGGFPFSQFLSISALRSTLKNSILVRKGQVLNSASRC